jgi:hypothetical protein
LVRFFATGPVETVMTSEELSKLYGVALNVQRTPSGRIVVGRVQCAVSSTRSMCGLCRAGKLDQRALVRKTGRLLPEPSTVVDIAMKLLA